jgi:hypothetical protein
MEEVLTAIHESSLSPDASAELVETVFKVVNAWYREQGPHTMLRNVVCSRLGLDHRTFALYAQAPELVPRLETLRRTLFHGPLEPGPSAEALWPRILHVLRVIHKVGAIAHAPLLRWVGRETPAWWLRKVLAHLIDAGLVERHQEERVNPRWPATLYRLVSPGAGG